MLKQCAHTYSLGFVPNNIDADDPVIFYLLSVFTSHGITGK